MRSPSRSGLVPVLALIADLILALAMTGTPVQAGATYDDGILPGCLDRAVQPAAGAPAGPGIDPAACLVQFKGKQAMRLRALSEEAP
jgi:hypothetical protein